MRARSLVGDVLYGNASLLAADVRNGLFRGGQKSLPPRWFYDDVGSLLFEAITRLPEYGVGRAEQRLLGRASDEIAAATRAHLVIELGAGSGRKARDVLRPIVRRGATTYCPVEVSTLALEQCRRELADLPDLSIRAIESDYLEGLETALRQRAPGVRALVLFLGSSLGNFDGLAGTRFLREIRRRLRPGDALLLGADLEKPEARLLAAYDDAFGVTAAFNLNVLARINRELGANFVLPRFRHRVRFDPLRRNVEMHLESQCEQTIEIAALDAVLTLGEGETIHTENSHKYSTAELAQLVHATGWRLELQWRDEEWPFASSLLRVP